MTEIYLIMESIDRYRWISIVDAHEDLGIELARLRGAPAANELPAIPVEWLPTTADRDICDFPIFRTTLKCVSRRARQALDDLFEPNGEWLKIEGLGGDYSAFHCLREVDCLDKEALQMSKSADPDLSFHSRQFVPTLKRGSLQSCDVFRIPESVNKFFVSAEFARRYREHGFTGLEFIDVTLS